MKLQVRGGADRAPLKGDRTRLRHAFAACLRAILREQASPCTIVVDRQRHSTGPGARAVIVMAREPDVQRAYDAVPAAFDDQRGGLGLCAAHCQARRRAPRGPGLDAGPVRRRRQSCGALYNCDITSYLQRCRSMTVEEAIHRHRR